jgi:hypothetical protein
MWGEWTLTVLGTAYRGGGGTAAFATGTDEGVRPYTGAQLRRRWTGGSTHPCTFLVEYFPIMHEYREGLMGFSVRKEIARVKAPP